MDGTQGHEQEGSLTKEVKNPKLISRRTFLKAGLMGTIGLGLGVLGIKPEGRQGGVVTPIPSDDKRRPWGGNWRTGSAPQPEGQKPPPTLTPRADYGSEPMKKNQDDSGEPKDGNWKLEGVQTSPKPPELPRRLGEED